MFKQLIAVLALALVGVVAQAEDYRTVPVQGRLDKPGMIEVREFFWYGCPHCFKLEPHVAEWLKTKPADVNFVRSPAALNPVWEANARGYYTAETLGLVEKTHAALFKTINVDGKRLFDQASLASFYEGYGVKAANFNGLYHSFAVNGKVAQSKSLAQFYQLDGVPALVVNGKYVVKGEGAEVMATVQKLIAKERATQKH